MQEGISLDGLDLLVGLVRLYVKLEGTPHSSFEAYNPDTATTLPPSTKPFSQSINQHRNNKRETLHPTHLKPTLATDTH